MSAARRGRLRAINFVAVRQFVGDREKLLVRSRSKMVVLHTFERANELLLIVVGKYLIGHVEQAVVFLLDVFS